LKQIFLANDAIAMEMLDIDHDDGKALIN